MPVFLNLTYKVLKKRTFLIKSNLHTIPNTQLNVKKSMNIKRKTTHILFQVLFFFNVLIVLNATFSSDKQSTHATFLFSKVLVLGNAFTLEQRLQLSEAQVQGNSSLHHLLIHNKGESLMLNLVLPLCLKIGCGNKDDPKLRRTDIQFTLNLLLNMINPNKRFV